MQTNRVFRLLAGWVVLFALCALVMPLFAQEATPEPEAPPVEADGSVTVPLDYLWSVQNLAQYAVIVSGVLGLAAIGGSFFLLNRQSKDALEKVYMSAPPEHQQIANRLISIADSLVQQLVKVVTFAKEVTDGKPNSDPPPLE